MDASEERPTRKLTVYLCKGCSNVLANSEDNVQLVNTKFLLFTEVQNTLMTTSVKVSTDAYDNGCTYHILHCKCDVALGKHYVSVPPKFKTFENKYVLSLINLKSVETEINDVQNTEVQELKVQMEEVAVMLVSASMERLHLKEAIVNLGKLVQSLKQEIDDLKRQQNNESIE